MQEVNWKLQSDAVSNSARTPTNSPNASKNLQNFPALRADPHFFTHNLVTLKWLSVAHALTQIIAGLYSNMCNLTRAIKSMLQVLCEPNIIKSVQNSVQSFFVHIISCRKSSSQLVCNGVEGSRDSWLILRAQPGPFGGAQNFYMTLHTTTKSNYNTFSMCSVAFLAPPRGLPRLRARIWPRVLKPHWVQSSFPHIT